VRSPSKTFPGVVRGTADPSATLGMTKGRAALSFGADTVDDEQQVPPLRVAPVPRQAGTGGMTVLLGTYKTS
jgi:hypothetical protein